MNKYRKNVVLVVVIVLTLLVAFMATSFAYFNVTIIGNESISTSVIVKTGTLGLVYEQGNEIVADKVLPGWNETKTFTVTNTGTESIKYKIYWEDVINDFTDKSELTYVISGSVTTGTGQTNSIVESPLPIDSGNIDGLRGIVIEPGATHTFTLTVRFKELESDQVYNQGKTFTGKIQIDIDTYETTDYVLACSTGTLVGQNCYLYRNRENICASGYTLSSGYCVLAGKNFNVKNCGLSTCSSSLYCVDASIGYCSLPSNPTLGCISGYTYNGSSCERNMGIASLVCPDGYTNSGTVCYKE